MRIRDIIAELTRPNTRQEAGQLLRQNGYEPVGAGTFSSLWGKPGDPFIVKLFRPNDVAYLRYIRLAKAMPNEHFPVVRGQPTRVSDTYWGVRIERLSPPDPGLRYLVSSCSDYLGALNMLDEFRGDRKLSDELRTVVNALRFNAPTLATALDAIHKYVIAGDDNIMNDVKMLNVGMRGKTLVFIDPVMIGGMYENVEPSQEDLENIEHDKAVKRKPDMRQKRFVAMPGNTSSYPAL